MSKKNIMIILVALLVGAVSLAGYLFWELRSAKQNPQAAALKEAEDLVEKVSKLMVLPEGETPTVATVSDPEALVDQPFFAKAHKGDKVLIYAQAKKAVLYSPYLDRILDVAPLNIGEGDSKTETN